MWRLSSLGCPLAMLCCARVCSVVRAQWQSPQTGAAVAGKDLALNSAAPMGRASPRDLQVASNGTVVGSWAPRKLQETYAFLMSELTCTYCCESEYRACDCIMNCDMFKDRCDGINRPQCEILRDCYVRLDDEEPKGHNSDWQCGLMKCISYCLRHQEVCDIIRDKFRVEHCLKSLELDMPGCDVDCAVACRLALPDAGLLMALLVVIGTFAEHMLARS